MEASSGLDMVMVPGGGGVSDRSQVWQSPLELRGQQGLGPQGRADHTKGEHQKYFFL